MDTIVLLSGGLDSAVLLAHALDEGRSPLAISFLYGQRQARQEMNAARAIAAHYAVERRVVDLRDAFALIRSGARAVTPYVPNRNALLLSVAVALAESCGAERVWYGATVSDRGDFPDCRPEFISAFDEVARLGTRSGVGVEAPFSEVAKYRVVLTGTALRVPLALTYSCYEGFPRACGVCGACRTRARAFGLAGLSDPRE